MSTAASVPALHGLANSTLIAAAVGVLVIWFVPIFIALLYDLPRKGAVAVLSLLLGWTVIGWLAALVITVAGAILVSAPGRGRRGAPPASTPPYGISAGPY